MKVDFITKRKAYERMDFDKFTQEEVSHKLFSLIENQKIAFKFGEVKLTKDMYFVRVRPELDNKPFEHINEFWAPPPEFTNVGRCNKAGEPKLYTVVGTNIQRDLLSLVEEVNIQPGTHFVVIIYKLKKNLSFNVPLSHDLFPNMQGTEPVDNKLSKFLVSEFLINPEKGIRSRYKSTASIVDLMMNPEGHKCKSPVFSYPSCAMNRALKVESNGVVNLAWDPQFAKESLEIESLRRVTMEWDTGWKIGSNLSKTTKKAGINVREKGVILSSGAVEWKL